MEIKPTQVYDMIIFHTIIKSYNKTVVFNHIIACKDVNSLNYEVKKFCECAAMINIVQLVRSEEQNV